MKSLPLLRMSLAGLMSRSSCWLLLGGALVFAWLAPLVTPWQENPQILQPARAQAAWVFAWLALFTWLPFQAAALGRRLPAQRDVSRPAVVEPSATIRPDGPLPSLRERSPVACGTAAGCPGGSVPALRYAVGRVIPVAPRAGHVARGYQRTGCCARARAAAADRRRRTGPGSRPAPSS